MQGGGSKVYYYSKADGEFYPFCFDPLCQHQDLWDGEKYVGTTCVAKMLYWNNGTRTNANTPPQYCNGKIYFVYFDEIWSCNEYATDIRIDVSFSKLPSDITKTEARNRMNSGLSCFQQFMIGGNSVFFDHLDADGEVRYYRLDTETRKLHDLTEEMEGLAKEHELESLIFQYAIGNYIRFVGLNTESKKAEYITTDQNLNPTSIPFLGENDILSVLRNTANGQLCGIRRFDEEHNLLSSVYVEVMPDGEYRSLDVGENGIYVTKNYTYGTGGESVKLGYGRTSSVTGKSEEVINHNNGIARYDKETGEKELLFQDDWLNLDTIFYINENTGDFIASMTKYKQNTGGIISSGSGIIYTGKLVDGKLANFEEAIAPDAIFVEPPYDIPG